MYLAYLANSDFGERFEELVALNSNIGFMSANFVLLFHRLNLCRRSLCSKVNCQNLTKMNQGSLFPAFACF